ncbi:MAG TPA: AAA family ATPase [Leptospiraceae bacterium]|nr:AAA family ATPase [Leptospiraceae bacterium]
MSNNTGSKLYSIDFHVHTPASQDYKDKNISAADIISRAVEVGIDALVIVDHNTCAWIDILRQSAENKGITIFPGFEVNTSGGHVLGVFDPQSKMEEVETALIRCGIDKKDFGNEAALGRPIEEVIDTISANGGIAIGAHIDKEKGVLKVVDQGVATMRIYKNPRLSAVEITDINSKEEHISGKYKGTGRVMACVQGSDAHSLQKIGDKITYLKVSHLSLEGLRQAFTEPAYRIKFPGEIKEINYPHIIKIMVSQGFLAKQEIFFNSGFNCIVGGAGTGKSTILEFIRFALDQVSSIPEIADDCYAKVRELAKNGAKIYVQFKSATGETYMICRTYDGNENPISIVKHSSKEQVKNVEVKNLFRVHAFSQGEAISIARNPLAQLDLIDNHLNLGSYKREIESTYNAIKDQKGIVVLQGKTSGKSTVEKEKTANELQLESLMKKLNSLEEAQKNPIIQSHQLWNEESDYFQQLNSLINSTKEEILTGIDGINFPIQSIPKLNTVTPNIEKINQLVSLTNSLTESKQKAKGLLLDTLKNIESEIGKTFSEWDLLYKSHAEAYQKIEESAPFGKIREINTQISELKTAIKKNDNELSSIQSAQKTLDSLLQKRKEYKGVISDQKSRIRTLRERKAREFSERLKGSVRIKLIDDGNTEAYENFISSAMRGQYMGKDKIKQLCKAIHP